MSEKKTGLVMEGGAMRGMFTAGVTDVLMENGITFDGAMGVSAGATFGCNLKSQQIGRTIRYNKRFCGDPRYASFKSWLKTGDLFGEEFCYHELPEKLDVFDTEAFTNNPMDFWVVATNVETGGPVYYQCTTGKGVDLEWIRASASMPMLSRVVEIGDHHLLDGGVADSIPVRQMEKFGYEKIVVILTQPLDYRKKKNQYLPLAKILLRKYPKMIEAMANRHIRYNKTTAYIRRKEQAGELFAIRPPEALNIKSTVKDPAELERVYQMGRQTMLDRLPELKAYLQE